MAEQKNNLILKLRLDVDTSSADKLVTLTKSLDEGLKATANNTNELAKVETARSSQLQAASIKLRAIEEGITSQRAEASKKAQEAYNKLQELVNKNNKLLEEGVKWSSLVIVNTQRAVDKHNDLQKAANEQLQVKIAEIVYEKSQLDTLIIRISAEERINKIYEDRKLQIQNIGSLKTPDIGSLKALGGGGPSEPIDYTPKTPTGSYNYGTGTTVKPKKEEEQDNYNLVEKALAKTRKLEEDRYKIYDTYSKLKATAQASYAAQEIKDEESLATKLRQVELNRIKDTVEYNTQKLEAFNSYTKQHLKEEEQLADKIRQIELSALKADIEERAAVYATKIKEQASYAMQSIAEEEKLAEKLREIELASLRADIEERAAVYKAKLDAQANYASQSIQQEEQLAARLRQTELNALKAVIEERNNAYIARLNAQTNYAQQAIAQEQDLADRTRQIELNALKSSIEERHALEQQKSNAKSGYAQQTIKDEDSYIKSNRDRELAALRSSMEEQHQIRMASFNRSLAIQESSLKSSISIQVAEQLYGIQSVEAVRARAAEQSIVLEQNRQDKLARISRKVQTGNLTPEAGSSQAARINDEHAASIVRLNTQLRNHEEASNQVAKSHSNLFTRVGELVGAYTIWDSALNAVTSVLRSLPAIGIELESTQASLSATTGSAAGMVSVMRALDAEAKRTGIEIGTLRETFRGFQASTSLAGESMDSTWHMFTNLNTVITGLHLPADKANGIFLAMAQMFNKTKVQSEELVKQLGNLLPGAFASFATANNVAFGGQFENSIDLIAQMKKGTVFAHETIERFTQFMADRFEPAFAYASHGLNAAVGRMKSSYTLLVESIYGGSSEIILNIVKTSTTILEFLRGAIDGTNMYGKIFKEVFVVGTVFGIAMLGNLARASIISTAATIVETEAIVARTAARRAEAIAAGIQVAAVESMGLAAAVSTIAAKGLGVALAFLSSPAGIIAGIGLIAYSLYDLATSSGEASEKADKFLEELKTNLDKTKIEPFTLEMKVDADPLVVEAKERLKDVTDIVEKTQRDLEQKGPLFTNVFNLARLDEDKKRIVALEQALVAAKDQAYIKVTVDTGGALKDIEDIAQHFKVLALEAQGLSEEAGKIKFDETNKKAIETTQANIEDGIKNVDKWRATLKQKEEFEAAHAKKVAEIAKYNATNPTFRKSINDSNYIQELKTLVKASQEASTNIANYENSLQVQKNQKIARDTAGINKDKQEKLEYTNFLLGLDAVILKSSTDSQKQRQFAERTAEIEANKARETQRKAYEQVKARPEEQRTKEDTNFLNENANVLVKIEQAKTAKINEVMERFNKKQESETNKHNSEMKRLNKDLYKDYERDANQVALDLDAALNRQTQRYNEHLTSIKDYYRNRKELRERAFEDQVAILVKEQALARTNGDASKIEQLQDKIDALEAKLKAANIADAIQQTQAQITYNNALADTNIQLQRLLGNTAKATRMSLEQANKNTRDIFNAEINSKTNTPAEKQRAQEGLNNLDLSEEIQNTRAIAEETQTYKDKVDAVRLAYIDLGTQTSSSLSTSLGSFGPLMNTIDTMTAAYANQQVAIERLTAAADELAKNRESVLKFKAEGSDEIKAIDKQIKQNAAEQELAQQTQFRSQVKGAGDTFSAIEKMTAKNSAINKAAHTAQMVMNGIEFAFKLKDMALTIVSFTTGFALKAKDMAMNIAALPAALSLGAAQMFAQSGWAGFAGVAAMIALIAAIGIAASGGNTTTTNTSMKESDGKGTTFGYGDKESTSIADSLKLMLDIDYKSYKELIKIGNGIRATDNSITKIIRANATGNLLEASTAKTGSKDNMAVVAGAAVAFAATGIGAIFALLLYEKVTIKKLDEGVHIIATKTRDVLAGSNVLIEQYTTLEKTTSSAFETTVEIYDVMQKASKAAVKLFTNLYYNMANSIRNLAVDISKAATDAVYLYKFPEIKISLKNQGTDKFIKKIQGIIGKQLDLMAKNVFGGLFGDLRDLGEGMFTTVNRLYAEYAVAKKGLEEVGGTFEPNVVSGMRLADALIAVSSNADTAAGRLKEFAQQEAEFAKNFLTTNKKNTLAVKNFADSVAGIFQSGLTKEQVGASQTFTEKQVGLVNATANESKAMQVESKAWDKYSAAFDKNWVGKLSDKALKPIYDAWVVTRKSLDKAQEDVKTATDSLVPASTVTNAKTLKQVFFEAVKTTGDFGSAIITMQNSLDLTTESGLATHRMLTSLDTTFTSLTADILKPIDDQINTIKDSIDARTVEEKMAALASSKDINEQRKLTTSLQKQITAKYDTEKSAINNIKNSFIKLADTVKSLLLSDLSTLDPYAKFKEAQKEYDLTLEQTRSTDLAVASEAAGKLGTVAQNYLKEAQSYFGATEAYANIFNSVTGTLSDLSTTATTQAEANTEAIKTLGEAAIKQLEDLSTGFIKSVSDRLQELVAKSTVTLDTNSATDMLAKLTTSANNLGQAFNTLITKFNAMMAVTPTQDKSNMQLLTEQLVAATTKSQSTDKATKATGKQEVTNINEQINSYSKGFKKGGVDLAELYSKNRKDIQTYNTTIAKEEAIIAANKKLKASDPKKLSADELLKHKTTLQEATIAKAAIVDVGAFASGGTASGMTLVGERGPELLRLPHNTQVINNNNTNRLLEDNNKASLNILTDMKKELIILNNRMETIERKTRLSKPTMGIA